MDIIKKKKKHRVWLWLCIILAVVICTLALMSLLNDKPAFYGRMSLKRADINKQEFFLEHEDRFEYVVDYLDRRFEEIIKSLRDNFQYGYYDLRIGITRRTHKVVFAADGAGVFKTYVFAEDLGIVLDDEFIGCLNLILVEGKLGRVSINKWTSNPKLEVTFGNGSRDEARITYCEPIDQYRGNDPNIKGNWFCGENLY